MKKNIKLAKHAGFCYGVKRAVLTTKKLKAENNDKEIFVLGELIHNSHVINELSELGIHTVDSLPDDGTGICIVRSHGASPAVFNDIKQKGYETVDLTCPDVKKVLKDHKKIGVVVQTTQRIENLKSIVDYLIPLAKELKVFNTICASTSLRQSEARNLAQESDLMVVVGSKKSANTTHLAEILTGITPTIHIETVDELRDYEELIKKAQNIGVTAGASTPDAIIDNVIKKLNQY